MIRILIVLHLLLSSAFASGAEKCADLLGSLAAVDSSVDLVSGGLQITTSQAQRLEVFFQMLSAQERQALFRTLGQLDSNEINDLIRKLDRNEIPRSLRSFTEQHQGIEMVLRDLLIFGHAFPTIFGLPNADMTIGRVLTSIRRQEVIAHLGNPDLLQSQSKAPALSRTIDNTLVNVILRASHEYQGMRFGRSVIGSALASVGRFFSPLYSKVREVIEFAQIYQRQLVRLRLIDQLVIQLGLGEARTLKLNADEVQQLTAFVLDSPQEINEIQEVFKKVFHESFESGKPVEIPEIKIRETATRGSEHDVAKDKQTFDKDTIHALGRMNSILSQSRERQGQNARQLADFHTTELQLLTEARERQVGRLSGWYFGWTDTRSKERYTIEESYTVYYQVPDGTDEKGNPKTRTESRTEYRDVTVNPTIEQILTKNFPTGDRYVTGLDRVVSRTERVRNSEARYRETIEAAEEQIEEFKPHYASLVLKGYYSPNGTADGRTSREAVMTALVHKLARLRARLPELKTYAAKSDGQIRNNYENDILENFRGRNNMMVARYENMIVHIEHLHEALRRQQPRLYPVFDQWDYTTWLSSLRARRNMAYLGQAAIATGIVGTGTAYVTVPEFHHMVDGWAHQAGQALQAVLQGLGLN